MGKQITDDNPRLTTKEAAALLGCSPQALRSMARSGKIPFFHPRQENGESGKGTYYFYLSNIEDFKRNGGPALVADLIARGY